MSYETRYWKAGELPEIRNLIDKLIDETAIESAATAIQKVWIRSDLVNGEVIIKASTVELCELIESAPELGIKDPFASIPIRELIETLGYDDTTWPIARQQILDCIAAIDKQLASVNVDAEPIYDPEILKRDRTDYTRL